MTLLSILTFTALPQRNNLFLSFLYNRSLCFFASNVAKLFIFRALNENLKLLVFRSKRSNKEKTLRLSLPLTELIKNARLAYQPLCMLSHCRGQVKVLYIRCSFLFLYLSLILNYSIFLSARLGLFLPLLTF